MPEWRDIPDQPVKGRLVDREQPTVLWNSVRMLNHRNDALSAVNKLCGNLPDKAICPRDLPGADRALFKHGMSSSSCTILITNSYHTCKFWGFLFQPCVADVFPVGNFCVWRTKFPDFSGNVVFRTFRYLKIRTIRCLEISWPDLLTQRDVPEGRNPEVPFTVYEKSLDNRMKENEMLETWANIFYLTVHGVEFYVVVAVIKLSLEYCLFLFVNK